MFHASGNEKKVVVAIFISEKQTLSRTTVTKDKECHYTMINKASNKI